MCRLGKAKVLSNFLCPALATRPSQAVVVVKRGITMKTRKSYHCPLCCGRKIGYTIIVTNELAV